MRGIVREYSKYPEPKLPSLGDERIESFFAFLSVEIGGEWRWMEFVTVRQEYSSWEEMKWVYHPPYDGHHDCDDYNTILEPVIVYGWRNIEFV